MNTILQAVGIGMLVLLVGTIPRNIAFIGNLRLWPSLPWAVPVVGFYIWLFWRYVRGDGPPASTSQFRRLNLRANPLTPRLWAWALLAGGLGIITLVLALRVLNRLVALPEQDASALSQIPVLTAWSLQLMSAPVAGIIEEAAFRGYMQGPIERRYGLTVAILITGTMFAIAHLDFTPVLWPYYVAVAAIYGVVTRQTNSIWPAIVLHTSGNLYSNFDLLLHGRAEWQAPSSGSDVIWTTGIDEAFVRGMVSLVVAAAVMVWAYVRLAAAARREGSSHSR